MKLFLLRHGPAGESKPGAGDSERALTAAGRRVVSAVAHGLANLGVRFHRIAASPLVRARQTAEIVARVHKAAAKPDVWPELAPGASSGALAARLRAACKPGDAVLLVGHEPSLSGFASHLMVGDARVEIVLKKAGICRLDVTTTAPASAFALRATADRKAGGPPAVLRWLLTPRQAARLRTRPAR